MQVSDMMIYQVIVLFPSGIYLLSCIFSYCFSELLKCLKRDQQNAKFIQNSLFMQNSTQILLQPTFEVQPTPNVQPTLQVSFFLKQRFSVIVCLTLFLQMIFDAFTNFSLYFQVIHVAQLTIWGTSTFLLKFDLAEPRFYKQPLFWVLSLVSDCISLNIEEVFRLNQCLLATTIMRIILECFLSIYGIFKYDDRNHSKNVITGILDKIEGLELIPRVLCFPTLNKNQTTHSTEMMSLSRSSFFSKLSPSLSSPSPFQQRLNLFSENSTVDINIDRFISTKMHSTEKVSYTIRTFVKPVLYRSERTYSEFERLLGFLTKKVARSQPFVYEDTVTYFETASFGEEDISNSEKILVVIIQFEELLRKTAREPKLFNKTKVLEFLTLLDPRSELIRKGNPLFKAGKRNSKRIELNIPPLLTKNPELICRRKLKESLQIPLICFEHYEMGHSDPGSSIMRHFFFRIAELGFLPNPANNFQIDYRFSIMNISTTPIKSWEISRTFTDFKNLTENLTKELRTQVPNCTDLAPRGYQTKSNEYYQRKSELLAQYLQALVQNLRFHCEVLYQFIGFDGDRGNPNTPQNSGFIGGFSSAQLRKNLCSPKLVGNQREIFFQVFDEIPEQGNSIFNLGQCNRQKVNGIDFNLVHLYLRSIKGVALESTFEKPRISCYYNIDLTETYPNRSKTRTLITVTKQFKDFVNLNEEVNIFLANVGFEKMQVPDDVQTDELIGLSKAKKEWDAYLEKLRNLPRIEENESFRVFFCLNFLRSNFQYDRKEVEIISFTY